MKLDDIFLEWKKDSKIDVSQLAVESLKIPELHWKYLQILSHEKLILNKKEADYKSLFKLKFEYYLGTISEEDRKEKGWSPNPLRIVRQDIQTYIEADKDMVEINLFRLQQVEKVEVLENIIRSINNRSFMITNALNDIKFKNGVN
jgi:hypothetical protein